VGVRPIPTSQINALAGALAYPPKPFDDRALLAALRRAAYMVAASPTIDALADGTIRFTDRESTQ
jgi:hypothetical protein